MTARPPHQPPGSDKADYAPNNWYASRVFEDEERALIRAVGPSAGQRVLDAACGGSADTLYLAEAVAPGGEVVGVDLSPAHVAYARERLEEWGHVDSRVQLLVADLADLPPELDGFDFLWISFALTFFYDPAEVLRRLVGRLEPGGRVAVRGWGGADYEHFIPEYLGPAPGLMGRLYHAIRCWTLDRRREGLGGTFERDPAPYGVLGLMAAAGLTELRMMPFAAQVHHPLSDDASRFLRLHLGWLRENADIKPYLSVADHERFRELTDHDHKNYLPKRPDFHLVRFSTVGVGTRPNP